MPGGILSFLIFFPIISGIVIGIFSQNKYLNVNVKKTSLLITGIQMILSILVFFSYDKVRLLVDFLLQKNFISHHGEISFILTIILSFISSLSLYKILSSGFPSYLQKISNLLAN